MRLQVTVRRGHVTDDVRRYVESKLAKLGRRLHPDTLVEVVLDRERNPKIADDHIVEAELHMKGPNLFGREAASTLRGRDGSPRRQARAPGRAAPRQEGARAAPPRAGVDARARARRGDRAGPPPPERVARVPLPHDPGPHWGEVGIHGLHRQREWDAIATVERPDEGSEAWFVVLADGSLVREAGDADPASFRETISVPPPFRAHAVRRDGTTWAVAARRIETVELQDAGGDEIEIAWDGSERTVRIDGEPTLGGVPTLERLGAARHSTYVVTAARIAGEIWEIAVSPL